MSEQPPRKVVQQFRKAGWTVDRVAGSRSVWVCPSGEHRFSLPDGHRTISPGVFRKASQALNQCKH